MREAELAERMRKVLGDDYVSSWSDQMVLAALGGRTVTEALRDGVPCKQIWRAVWQILELPDNLR